MLFKDSVLVWAIENFFFFLNYQLFDILRDSLRTPSGNLYIVGLLLYIHSRHLANYLRAKVCLSTRNTTKVAIPFFQGTCNADWLVEERDTCTNTETVYKARGICLGVRVGTIHKNLIHRWYLLLGLRSWKHRPVN